MTDEEKQRVYVEAEYSIDGPWNASRLRKLRNRLRRAILSLFQRDTRQQTSSEDNTCGLICECGADLFIGGELPQWCPACHRGYEVKFLVKQYPRFLYPGASWVETHEQSEAEWRKLEEASRKRFTDEWIAEHTSKPE